MGYDATVDSDDIRVDNAPDLVARAFPWTEDSSVCVIRRLIRASGDPAVFCIDYIPMAILPADIAERPNGRQSIFDFLRQVANRQVRYSVAEIVPVVPPDEIAGVLAIPRDQPMMLLQHTHIDKGDQPVAMTKAYVNDRLLRFSVVRTYNS
jgi:GntR family transcriptional regulator